MDRASIAAVLFDGGTSTNHVRQCIHSALEETGHADGRTSKGGMTMDTRNEIKSYIVREGMTMADLVEKLAEQYGWSASVPNLSGKLRRDSLRYREAVELADALGYDIIWQRRREVR